MPALASSSEGNSRRRRRQSQNGTSRRNDGNNEIDDDDELALELHPRCDSRFLHRTVVQNAENVILSMLRVNIKMKCYTMLGKIVE